MVIKNNHSVVSFQQAEALGKRNFPILKSMGKLHFMPLYYFQVRWCRKLQAEPFSVGAAPRRDGGGESCAIFRGEAPLLRIELWLLRIVHRHVTFKQLLIIIN